MGKAFKKVVEKSDENFWFFFFKILEIFLKRCMLVRHTLRFVLPIFKMIFDMLRILPDYVARHVMCLKGQRCQKSGWKVTMKIFEFFFFFQKISSFFQPLFWRLYPLRHHIQKLLTLDAPRKFFIRVGKFFKVCNTSS